MKTLTRADAERLANALYEACKDESGPNGLAQILIGCNKDFDRLTSRRISLFQNAQDIARAAIAEGWGSDVLQAAREAQPDNPAIRALWASLPDRADAAVDPVIRRVDRPSLKCGRADQWNEVLQWGPAPQHSVLLVFGAAGQAASHFEERIKVYLELTPQPSIVLVDWATRPVGRDGFFEPIAQALNVETSGLRDAIANRLALQDLVLMHGCIGQKFDDPELVQYYTDYLPSLVADARGQGRLKCVQPIEWPAQSAAASWLDRLIHSRDRDSNDRDGALDFMKALQAARKGATPVQLVDLPELRDLKEDEIRRFLRNSGWDDKKQDLMMVEVRKVPQLPASVFKIIDTCWNRIQAAS